MNGRLFVVSAPSGAGKTTLLKKVMAKIPGLAFSVSHTTRQIRPGERNGVEYYFVDEEEFFSLRRQGVFLESVRVHQEYYGTSREAVKKQLEAGIDVILDIDVQGAKIVRELPDFDAAFIFIAPPSLAELERRLRQRQTENDAKIRVRMNSAREELAAVKNYHYLLVNDNLEQASQILAAIIIAERARQHRDLDGQLITMEVSE